MKRTDVFSGPAVSMQQILLRREQRVLEQRAMLEEAGCSSLVSFTLNIPGPVKQSPALQMVFDAGKKQLSLLLAGHILKKRVTCADTGSELLLALDLAPETVKSRLVQLENSHPIGRLFDMDVLNRKGLPLSRTAFAASRRRCLVCGQDAKLVRAPLRIRPKCFKAASRRCWTVTSATAPPTALPPAPAARFYMRYLSRRSPVWSIAATQALIATWTFSRFLTALRR